MLLNKTPNHAKFCGDQMKYTRNICDQKFVLPEKVGQSSPKIFGGCYSPKLITIQNFVAIN